MPRIHVYLNDREREDLARLSIASGLTLSGLVRESIRASYGAGAIPRDEEEP